MKQTSDFKKNTLSVGINNILLNIIGLFSSIIVARTLGPSNQGLIAIFLLLPTILSKFISPATQTATSYFLNSKKFSNTQISQTLYSFSLLSSFAIALLLLLFYRPTYTQNHYFHLTASLAISLFSSLYILFNLTRANLLGLFYAQEKYSLSNNLNLINDFLVSLLLTLLWLTSNLSVSTIILTYLIVSVLGFLITLFYFRREKISLIPHFETKLMKKFLVYSLPLYYTNAVQSFQQRINIFFIGSYLGLTQIGIFTIAYNIAEKINEISRPLIVTHLPKVTQYHAENKEKSLKFTFSLVKKLLALYIIIFIPYIILIYYCVPIFYSSKYNASITPAIILSFAMIFWGITRILNNLFSATNKIIANSFILTCGLAINIIGTILAILAKSNLNILVVIYSFSFIATAIMQIIYISLKLGKNEKNLNIYPDFKGLFFTLKTFKKGKL